MAACTSDDSALDDTTPGTGAAPTSIGDLEPEPTDSAGEIDTSTVDSVDAATTTTATPRPSRCAPSDGDGEERVVRVWHAIGQDAGNFLDDRIAEFEQAFPNIRVEAEGIGGGYVGAISRLRDTPVEERPDVFMGTTDTVRLQVDSGGFVPVQECTDGETPLVLDGLLPVIDRSYRVDGTLWAAPYNVSTPVLYYDRARWARAGLDPDAPPTNIDDMERIARALVDAGEATTGLVLYDQSASWLVEHSAAQDDRVIVVPANGRSGTQVTAVDLGGEGTERLLARFRTMTEDGVVFWAGLNDRGITDLLQLINPNEPSGMTLHTSAALGDLVRLLPDLDVGIGPIPGNAPGSLAGGGAWWLTDSGDPAQVGAAWAFVEWLLEPSRVAALAAFTGSAPTTVAAAEDPALLAAWEEQPIFRVAYDQLAATPDSDAGAGMQVGPMVEVRRAIEIAASKVIDAGDDPANELAIAEVTSLELLTAYELIADESVDD